MSTILNTLKKLEEEKSILEHPLGIEGMVTKEDTGQASSFYRNPVKLRWVGGLIIVVGVLGVFWYYPSRPQPKLPRTFNPAISSPQPALVIAPKKKTEVNAISGVSMAGIPGKRTLAPLKPMKGEKARKKDSIKPKSIISERKSDTPSSIENVMKILESQSENIPEKKISDLMESIKISAEKNSQGKGQAPQTNGHISGLSIKGIIFFSEGNLANYIFASTEQFSSQKLKVGDQVQGAILESIHPNHVIFDDHGRFIAVGMGD